jgi:multidrug efflux pump subunit AcrA (membrane-fusion protein)
MVAEIYVPEAEIAHMQTGMDVSVELDGFPDEEIQGTIERVHPRAEVVDDESVFVAELKLDNPDGALRPGMNGDARVESGRRSLGWVLFHKPWRSLRRALAW